MTTTNDGQVLEFELGEETYCVSIDYVTEIVDVGDLTPVPNAPPHVEGVMDLRGKTTSIIDPKTVFGVDGEGRQRRIVVFDPSTVGEEGAVGWLVDEVDQVVGVSEADLDDAPSSDGNVTGVIKRDDEFVIQVDPRSVHAES